jgi:hypothetical protein
VGYYLCLYAERQVDGRWQSITGLNQHGSPEDIYWTKNFWRLFELLSSEAGLFSIQRGLPKDLSPELGERLGRFNPNQCWWVPAEDMMFPEWRSERVLMRGSVPARLSALFGDGRQPFPTDALEHAGMQDYAWYHRSRLSGNQPPVDFTGESAHIPYHASPDHAVVVTWIESLAEIAGEEFMTGVVDRLAALGSLDTLRLIGWYD